MKKYYYNSFRGFANEFDVISVDQTNAREVQQFAAFYERYMQSANNNWQLHQITAQRVREIVRNERQIKRAYERCRLNLVCNPVGATEIITATDFFAD